MSPGMVGTLVLWGLVTMTAMASVLQLAQVLGLSRMSLTFMMGTALSGRRGTATVLGFVLYVLGGWAFAFLYFAFLSSLGIETWWRVAVLGFFHGVFLLAALPLLPIAHPRMASEFHGATARRRCGSWSHRGFWGPTTAIRRRLRHCWRRWCMAGYWACACKSSTRWWVEGKPSASELMQPYAG